MARSRIAVETAGAALAAPGVTPISTAGAAPSTARAESPERSPSPSLRDGEETVAEARLWLGTPYRHQASVRGLGADCLGLVRGVWRVVVGAEPEVLPPYAPDWAEVGGEETLLAAARRWLVEVPLSAMRAGDVVLFRMAAGCAVKHCAILSQTPDLPPSGRWTSTLPPAGGEWRMVHAYWGRAVVESWMGSWWRRRLVAAFRFPIGE